MADHTGRVPRRWLAAFAVAVVLSGAAAGALATYGISPTYAATSTVLVGSLDRPSIANDFDVSSAVAGIYGDLIRSEAILGSVIEQLRLATDWHELRDRIHVDLDPNGIPIIAVTVYAASADEAVAIAQAITDRMFELSGAALARASTVSTTPRGQDIEGAIASVERRLAGLQRRTTIASAKARERLERQIERQSTLLMSLQDNYRGFAAAPRGAANQLQVLRSAEPRGGKIRPRLPIDAALGGTIAALAAAAVALTVAMRRRAGTGARASGGAIVRDRWALELTQATQDAYAGTATSSARR